MISPARKPNRLIREKSPYLLQHAFNPVDWHAWSVEAFEKSRRENKPIFLSIGYSTCHWCHVMEAESFESDAIAAALNASFVPVKMDREERPDIDRFYMGAVQAMTGEGGWPLNVFLTPDLKPFFGGTYFPPEPRWGRPGFGQILARVAELWKTERAALNSDSEKILSALKGGWEGSAVPSADLEEGWLKAAAGSLENSFDPVHGGFGGAPKFPMPVYFSLLLRLAVRFRDGKFLDLALAGLRAMAAGGIRDHLGGGFHRYSTDEGWRVPHFEKMLYDNAQLAAVYFEAYQAAGGADLLAVGKETLEYLLRDMRHERGAFCSAEDADSLPGPAGARKVEGAFYLWKESDLRELLKNDADLVCRAYGVEAQGNALRDPQGELSGKNVLYRAEAQEELASKMGLPAAEVSERLEAAKRILFEARARRPRPERDGKILASWNGLAISALAKGFRACGDSRYLAAAREAASFIREEMRDPDTRELFHRWADGERAVPAMSDDYSFIVQGLLDLYEACGEAEWLDWARELSRAELRLFSSPEGGLYMGRAGGGPGEPLIRMVEDSDNVEPSASSAAALNLLRLDAAAPAPEFREAALRALRRFGQAMRERPLSVAAMLSARGCALSLSWRS